MLFISEESQHTLLLSIVSMLVVIFALGLEGPTGISEEPIVIP